MHIERLVKNPIIYPNMIGLTGKLGKNINGPTLIKVPSWISNPLGKYYLYFSHHRGDYIRLAYSNTIEGPYTIYQGGVLHIKETIFGNNHIASPEIYIDNENQQIRMYFHTGIRGLGIYHDQGQTTYVAISGDGLHFTPKSTQLGPFYLRIFRYNGYFYGIAKNDNKDGVLVRSLDGLSVFEKGPTFMPYFRHCGLLLQDDVLKVFFTKAFDKPERIYLSTMKLSGDWMNWTLSQPIEIMRPKKIWEGGLLFPTRSKYGGTKAMRALRDPFIYEENNEYFLFYCVKGERGIAIARIYL